MRLGGKSMEMIFCNIKNIQITQTSWHTPASVAEPTVISQKSETDSEKGDDQNNDLLEKSLKSDDPESDDDPEVERSWRR